MTVHIYVCDLKKLTFFLGTYKNLTFSFSFFFISGLCLLCCSISKRKKKPSIIQFCSMSSFGAHTKRSLADSNASDVVTKSTNKRRKRDNDIMPSDVLTATTSNNNNNNIVQPPNNMAWQIELEKVAEVIEDMQIREDLIWRYFCRTQVDCRLALLGKLNAMFHHKYDTRITPNAHFRMNDEMLDYYDYVASPQCRNSNEQDLMFFFGLSFCPDFSSWLCYLHHRPENDEIEARMYPSTAVGTTHLRAHPNGQSPTPQNTTKDLRAVPPAAVMKPTTNHTERYIANHICRVNNYDAFRSYVEYVCKVLTSRIRGTLQTTFMMQSDLKDVVRRLRAEYPIQCPLPHPTQSEQVTWTRQLRQVIRNQLQ